MMPDGTLARRVSILHSDSVIPRRTQTRSGADSFAHSTVRTVSRSVSPAVRGGGREAVQVNIVATFTL